MRKALEESGVRRPGVLASLVPQTLEEAIKLVLQFAPDWEPDRVSEQADLLRLVVSPFHLVFRDVIVQRQLDRVRIIRLVGIFIVGVVGDGLGIFFVCRCFGRNAIVVVEKTIDLSVGSTKEGFKPLEGCTKVANAIVIDVGFIGDGLGIFVGRCFGRNAIVVVEIGVGVVGTFIVVDINILQQTPTSEV